MKIFKQSIIQLILSPVVAAVFFSSVTLYGASINSQYKIGLEYFNGGETERAIKVWQDILNEREKELSIVQKIALRQRLDYAIDRRKRETPVPPPRTIMDRTIQEFDRACRMAQSETNKDLAPDQFERVLELLEKSYEEGVITKDQSYYQAYCLVALDRLDEVPSLLDTAIENNPKTPEPLNLLAIYLDKTANVDQKLITLRKSLTIDPEQPEIEYRLVCALLATRSRKNLKEAAQVAVRAVKGNEEKARELAKLFPKSGYKERLERMATEIAIEDERTKMIEAMIASGRTYNGPKLKVIGGSSTQGAPAPEGGGGSKTGSEGTSPPAGNTPPPSPPG